MTATCSEAGQGDNIQGTEALPDAESPYLFLISSAVTSRDVLSLVSEFTWERLELSAEFWST